jgi:hypothetical protein
MSCPGLLLESLSQLNSRVNRLAEDRKGIWHCLKSPKGSAPNPSLFLSPQVQVLTAHLPCFDYVAHKACVGNLIPKATVLGGGAS